MTQVIDNICELFFNKYSLIQSENDKILLCKLNGKYIYISGIEGMFNRWIEYNEKNDEYMFSGYLQIFYENDISHIYSKNIEELNVDDFDKVFNRIVNIIDEWYVYYPIKYGDIYSKL